MADFGIGEAIALAGVAASIGSATASYVAQQSAANYQLAIARQNAQVQAQVTERNKRLLQTQKLAAESDLLRQQERKQSAIRAAIGAAGVGFGGSPLEILADSAAQAGRDLETLRFSFQTKIENAALAGNVAQFDEAVRIGELQYKKSQAFGTLIGGYGQAVGQAAEVGYMADKYANPEKYN